MRNRGPKSGSFSLKPSFQTWPFAVARNARKRESANPRTTPMPTPIAAGDATTKKQSPIVQAPMIARTVNAVFFCVVDDSAFLVNTRVRREVTAPTIWFDESALDTKMRSDVYQGSARSSVE